MNIGEKIKNARLAKKLTQDELAKQLGISKNAISNYENGVSTPKIELLAALMQALSVDANYIYNISAPNDYGDLTPARYRRINYDECVSLQLRMVQEQFGYTVQEFADILGISRKALQNYESGELRLPLDRITSFAETLNIPVEFFLPNSNEWHDSVVSDYFIEKSDAERIAIIKLNGFDPRVYLDYLRIKCEAAPIVPPMRLDDDERTLITAYRKADTGTRAAVEKLLDLNPISAQSREA